MTKPKPLPKPQLNKQKIKSEKAQDAICEATIQSLYEVGYAETTLNKVAHMAGFSKGALQHHFPSKEDLIAATVNRLLERTSSGNVDTSDSTTVNASSKKTQEHHFDSVSTALLWSWQKMVNTDQYRALLEVLNAARADKKLNHRISEDLHAWGRALDQQAVNNYQSVHGTDEDVKALLSMTRSFMRGLVIQEQYSSDPSENLDQIHRWLELVAPLLELRKHADKEIRT